MTPTTVTPTTVTSAPPRPRRRPAGRLLTPVAVVGSALVLASCSGTASDRPRAGSPGTPTAAVDAAPVQASIARVSGRLGRPARARLLARVTASVEGWVDHAYLGPYPRTTFPEAFTHFTPTAARRARSDGSLTSNEPRGSRLTSVTATRRAVRLDVLAVKGVAVGVTARVHLGFATRGSGGPARERVDGEVYLSYAKGDGWRIFGYDLTRAGA